MYSKNMRGPRHFNSAWLVLLFGTSISIVVEQGTREGVYELFLCWVTLAPVESDCFDHPDSISYIMYIIAPSLSHLKCFLPHLRTEGLGLWNGHRILKVTTWTRHLAQQVGYTYLRCIWLLGQAYWLLLLKHMQQMSDFDYASKKYTFD